MRALEKVAGLAFSAGVVIAGSLAFAGPANAASSPIAACGGGSYHEIDHHDLRLSIVYLLYNGDTNCVVTWKTGYIGTSTDVAAAIQIAGDDSTYKRDARQYKYYAGPVTVRAPGKCIEWGGGTPGSEWHSGPSRCG